MQQCHVQDFVMGKAHPEQVAAEDADVPLLQSVQAFLVDNGQVTLSCKKLHCTLARMTKHAENVLALF
jgi:hypothetical protein